MSLCLLYIFLDEDGIFGRFGIQSWEDISCLLGRRRKW